MARFSRVPATAGKCTALLISAEFRKSLVRWRTARCLKTDLRPSRAHLRSEIPCVWRVPGFLAAAVAGIWGWVYHAVHLPVNPGAQTHVPFRPSLSQVPPCRQLTLAQGSLYDSQCAPMGGRGDKGGLVKASPAHVALKGKAFKQPGTVWKQMIPSSWWWGRGGEGRGEREVRAQVRTLDLERLQRRTSRKNKRNPCSLVPSQVFHLYLLRPHVPKPGNRKLKARKIKCLRDKTFRVSRRNRKSPGNLHKTPTYVIGSILKTWSRMFECACVDSGELRERGAAPWNFKVILKVFSVLHTRKLTCRAHTRPQALALCPPSNLVLAVTLWDQYPSAPCYRWGNWRKDTRWHGW